MRYDSTRYRSTAVACLAALACLLGAPRCPVLPNLPALVSSLPADGAVDVPRTAWIQLAFAGAVSKPGALELLCANAVVARTATLVGNDTVILNPSVDLPANSPCEVRWLGPGGPTSISFTTAAAGSPATLLYDRTDPRALAPIPDDFFLVADTSTPTGQRVSLPVRTMPSPLEQSMANGLRAMGNRSDGWSAVTYLSMEVSEALELASLPTTPEASLDPLASIGWFDLTSGSPTLGKRIPFQLTLRSDLDPGTGITHHTLLLFPSIRLTAAGSYGVVVTRRAQVDASRPLDPSSYFAAALGPPQPGEAAGTPEVRALTEGVLEDIASHGELPFDAKDVALAVRLTVRSDANLPADMLTMRAAVDALPPPTFQIDSVGTAGLPGVAAVARGTWQAPEFRNSSSGLFERDVDGNPVQTGTNDVPFVLALPDASLTAPAPLIMYQHGNPGSAEEVPSFFGLTSTTGDSLADDGFAGVGFTDPLNREIPAGSGPQAVLLTIMAYQDVPAWDAQGWAEQIAFVKLLQSLDTLDVLPLGGGDGFPDLDVSTLQYLGLSAGAINGSAVLSYLPEIRAAALLVGGARQAEWNIHGAEDELLPQLQQSLPNLTPPEIWAGFVLFQIGIDSQEPHNHAIYLYRWPHPLGPPQRASLLITEGIGDSLVPNHATRALGWTFGPVLQVEPVQQASPVLTSVLGPLFANVNATTTAGYYQYVPSGVPGLDPSPGCIFQSEGHSCPQNAPEAVRQRSEFFQTALSEAAPVIIDPLAP